MVLEKWWFKKAKKKRCKQIFLHFLNVYYLKTHLIKAFNSIDWFFHRPYKRLFENKKIGSSRELLLPENDFKTSSTIPKTIQILEAWGHEIQNWHNFVHMNSISYKSSFGHLIGTSSSSKCHRFWGQNLKISAKKG